MKILLTQGAVALVDAEDYRRIVCYSWQLKKDKTTDYAKRAGYVGDRLVTIKMHRAILRLGPDDPEEVDHFDGDGLNNRKGNLRVSTHDQNMANRLALDGCVSKYKGVSRSGNLWRARVGDDGNGNRRHVGCYTTEEAAAFAFDEAARPIYGQHGTFNFPLPGERSALTGIIEPMPDQAPA